MDRRTRLMNTLHGKPVDRPAVCFYEINGLDENPADPSPFNVFSDPSWGPLLELARERSDRIVMRGVGFKDVLPDPLAGLTHYRSWTEGGSLYGVHTLRTCAGTLTARTRRDPDINTVWTLEHLLKDTDDLRAFLELPVREFSGEPDITSVLQTEEVLGDSGIVMLDTPDPLCLAAGLFGMSDYLVTALTERDLFLALLDRFAAELLPRTEAVARALPGRLWRIYGPEYAAPPYLPPSLFHDYVCRYVGPMVESIHRYGGFARIHCHGRVKDVLPHLLEVGAAGLDPIEPPPQGDVELAYVRQHAGRQMVLFGNIEESEIETLPTDRFTERARRAVEEGAAGEGRGFVLMPSSCPAGRRLSDLALRNYEAMVAAVEAL